MTSFVSDFHIFYDASVILGREANVIFLLVYLGEHPYLELGQIYMNHLNFNLTIGNLYMPAVPKEFSRSSSSQIPEGSCTYYILAPFFLGEETLFQG